MSKATDALAWIEKNFPEVTLADWQKQVVEELYDGARYKMKTFAKGRRNGWSTLRETLAAFEARKQEEPEPYHCPRPECSPHDVIADPEQHKAFHAKQDAEPYELRYRYDED